ncbi:MAG: hypothetical protein AB3N17_17615 [Tateyamaria sp.]
MVLILFTMAFVVGPALFLVLERMDGQHWPLALLASAFVVASFVLRTDAGVILASNTFATFLSVGFVWLAWVLVMVLVARAVRAAKPTRRARRLVRAAGAMGTTVPWFGFAAAQMMAR